MFEKQNLSRVITGASKVSQITENMKAIDASIMADIEKVMNNKPEEDKDWWI